MVPSHVVPLCLSRVRVMPTHVFLGTESAQVLCGELSADGSFQYRGRVAVSDAAAPAGKHGFAAKTAGAPMVEWLTAHPSGAWLYAFVSFWDKRPGQLRTFAVTPNGRLSAADDGEGVRMRGGSSDSHGTLECEEQQLHSRESWVVSEKARGCAPGGAPQAGGGAPAAKTSQRHFQMCNNSQRTKFQRTRSAFLCLFRTRFWFVICLLVGWTSGRDLIVDLGGSG